MAEDGLPRGIDGKMLGNEFWQLRRDIAPHPVIARKRRFRRIDVKARAKTEIVGIRGIAGNIFAARTGVGCNEDHSKLGAGLAELAFFGDVGVGAGQA